MKNFSKTISAVSLSLLTIGAMAQAPASFMQRQTPSKQALVKGVMNTHKKTHNVASSNVNGMLDYVDGDANNQGWTFGTNYTGWAPVMYMNARYTLADTVYSPTANNPDANSWLANSITVVYDTMWDNDAYLNSLPGFQTVQAGSLTIDTIWAILGYHNTSNTNDTLIFTINGVTAAGFPNAPTVYAIDTEIIAPHTTNVLPGTSLDSTYEVGFSTSVPIPASARAGWHFSINAKVLGSKLDTLGLAYYSALTQCSSANYNDTTTSMGPVNGALANNTSPKYTNSFITGLWWYNAPKPFGGPGGPTTWPIQGGANAGIWYNGLYSFYGFDPGGCGFIWYPYFQNAGILCSVSYSPSTGINNINNGGLSVGQNFPNPFNKTTQISYNLTKSSDITFSVYDITGRQLINNVYTNSGAGAHTINLSANSFSPGIYFYSFNVNGSVVTKKMVITE